MTTFLQRTGLAVAAVGGLLAATAMTAPTAFAGPTTTIDGVTIPVGVVPGGYYLDSELSFESLVTAVGQSFQGTFKVTAITDNLANVTYSYGNNNAFLTGAFQNFTVASIVAPTTTTAGTITFTGGTLAYYVESTDQNIAGTGSIATDIANATSGKLWLKATPDAVDTAGHTLSITLPAGNTLSNFAKASANAELQVDLSNPGDAGLAFNTNSFANAANGNMDDLLFQGTANSTTAGDFQVSGVNNLKANIAVPEPASLALLSGGLLGLGWFARRRHNRV